jgi:hypothetical protein
MSVHTAHDHENDCHNSLHSVEVVGTRIKLEPEAPAQNRKNWISRSGNPEGPVCWNQRRSGEPLARDKDASPPAK